MNPTLRSLLGTGLTWGLLWAAVGTSIGLVIGWVDPDSIDPGESPFIIGPLIGLMGVFSGLVFRVLLLAFERHRPILELPLLRTVLWGILGSAVVGCLVVLPGPLVRGDLGPVVADKLGQFCVFGGVLTLAWAALARWWVRRATSHPLG